MIAEDKMIELLQQMTDAKFAEKRIKSICLVMMSECPGFDKLDIFYTAEQTIVAHMTKDAKRICVVCFPLDWVDEETDLNSVDKKLFVRYSNPEEPL